MSVFSSYYSRKLLKVLEVLEVLEVFNKSLQITMGYILLYFTMGYFVGFVGLVGFNALIGLNRLAHLVRFNAF
jgi:hypothetical protein